MKKIVGTLKLEVIWHDCRFEYGFFMYLQPWNLKPGQPRSDLYDEETRGKTPVTSSAGSRGEEHIHDQL